jgi:hypothetical protein
MRIESIRVGLSARAINETMTQKKAIAVLFISASARPNDPATAKPFACGVWLDAFECIGELVNPGLEGFENVSSRGLTGQTEAGDVGETHLKVKRVVILPRFFGRGGEQHKMWDAEKNLLHLARQGMFFRSRASYLERRESAVSGNCIEESVVAVDTRVIRIECVQMGCKVIHVRCEFGIDEFELVLDHSEVLLGILDPLTHSVKIHDDAIPGLTSAEDNVDNYPITRR